MMLWSSIMAHIVYGYEILIHVIYLRYVYELMIHLF